MKLPKAGVGENVIPGETKGAGNVNRDKASSVTISKCSLKRNSEVSGCHQECFVAEFEAKIVGAW